MILQGFHRGTKAGLTNLRNLLGAAHVNSTLPSFWYRLPSGTAFLLYCLPSVYGVTSISILVSLRSEAYISGILSVGCRVFRCVSNPGHSFQFDRTRDTPSKQTTMRERARVEKETAKSDSYPCISDNACCLVIGTCDHMIFNGRWIGLG